MSQNYIANSQNSKVEFVIKNLGLNVRGFFTVLQGEMIFNANDLKKSQMNFSINSNSVDTGIKDRDKHLRKEEYFDVEKFDLITFKSTKIEAISRLNRYNVEGNLTIKGISKLINLELIISEKETNLSLKCNFEINRRKFKVGGSSFILSDNVKMNINIIADKKIL